MWLHVYYFDITKLFYLLKSILERRYPIMIVPSRNFLYGCHLVLYLAVVVRSCLPIGAAHSRARDALLLLFIVSESRCSDRSLFGCRITYDGQRSTKWVGNRNQLTIIIAPYTYVSRKYIHEKKKNRTSKS